MQSFVYVIESPSSFDLLDGRTEGRSLCEALTLSGISYFYSLATDRNTLLTALGNRLNEAWTRFGCIPTLHFSMHGKADGIALTNGDFISWPEFESFLAPLNNWVNGGLLICMSSCYGINAHCMASQNLNNNTYWALVGNSHTATWSDAAVAYITFYHLLFKGIDLDSCITGMRTASGDNNFYYIYGNQARQNWLNYINATQQNIIASPPKMIPVKSF